MFIIYYIYNLRKIYPNISIKLWFRKLRKDHNRKAIWYQNLNIHSSKQTLPPRYKYIFHIYFGNTIKGNSLNEVSFILRIWLSQFKKAQMMKLLKSTVARLEIPDATTTRGISTEAIVMDVVPKRNNAL